jgi:pyruvate formate lyase activating enzyme
MKNRDSFPTEFWERTTGGRVQCNVCPNHCRLAEGQRGACFVRRAEGGRVVLTTYGRSSGFCVDPIEKKPLNHFLPGTPVLSLGTAGCNLACSFCQNWDISRSRDMEKLSEEASPESIAEAARRLGCPSVAFTYNDPVIFMEYAVDIAKACHALGIRTVAVTAGYMCAEPRRHFYRHMDAANVDLKAFTDHFYRTFCGGRLEAVLETLRYLKRETSVWLEITTLLIPGENDSEDEVRALSRWVATELGPDVPLHFTAFHPDYKMLDHPATPPALLSRSRTIAMEEGLHFVYTGNVRDESGGATLCPGCGRSVIGRDGYHITAWQMCGRGACRFCGAHIAGVFQPEPGHWGAKRLAVHVRDVQKFSQ